MCISNVNTPIYKQDRKGSNNEHSILSSKKYKNNEHIIYFDDEDSKEIKSSLFKKRNRNISLHTSCINQNNDDLIQDIDKVYSPNNNQSGY